MYQYSCPISLHFKKKPEPLTPTHPNSFPSHPSHTQPTAPLSATALDTHTRSDPTSRNRGTAINPSWKEVWACTREEKRALLTRSKHGAPRTSCMGQGKGSNPYNTVGPQLFAPCLPILQGGREKRETAEEGRRRFPPTRASFIEKESTGSTLTEPP